MRPGIPAALAGALLLAACDGGQAAAPARPSSRPGMTAPATPSGPSGPSGPSETAAPDGRPGCAPASPLQMHQDLWEVRGTGRDVRLWGLLFPRNWPVRAGDEVKIVWRMTGAGDLTLAVTAPDGARHRLAWGPEPHGSSNYDRPGEEWGAGYRFTGPGCWRLSATRGAATAEVYFKVRPAR